MKQNKDIQYATYLIKKPSNWKYLKLETSFLFNFNVNLFDDAWKTQLS
jgi:hypothetical protein